VFRLGVGVHCSMTGGFIVLPVRVSRQSYLGAKNGDPCLYCFHV